MNISLITFSKEIEKYQSNHYGLYNKSQLINTYEQLPSNIKQYLMPNKNKFNNLWRGCDGIANDIVISFTSNKQVASMFGLYVIPFGEIKSYIGAIDTEKLVLLLQKFKIKNDIGDDEGEVIILNPTWNDNLDIRKYKVY